MQGKEIVAIGLHRKNWSIHAKNNIRTSIFTQWRANESTSLRLAQFECKEMMKVTAIYLKNKIKQIFQHH